MLIRVVGYNIAILWCVCRLFVTAQRAGNLQKLVCDNNDEELLRSTLIRDLKEEDLKHFDLETQIGAMNGVVVCLLSSSSSSHDCSSHSVFMKITGQLASRDPKCVTWFPCFCENVNCKTCLISLFQNLDLRVLFEILVIRVDLLENVVRALLQHLDSVVEEDESVVQVAVRSSTLFGASTYGSKLRVLSAHLMVHSRAVSSCESSSIVGWFVQESKNLSKSPVKKRVDVNSRSAVQKKSVDESKMLTKTASSSTQIVMPIPSSSSSSTTKLLLLTLDRVAFDQTALERAMILVQHTSPDVAIAVVMPILIVLFRQSLSLAHKKSLSWSWIQQISRIVRLVRCLNFEIMLREKSNWILWNQFLDLTFVFLDMFENFTSLKPQMASSFCSVGLMLYDFVSISTQDQIHLAHLEKNGKRVQQLGNIVAKWNFKSFSETFLLLSRCGDGVSKEESVDGNDDEHENNINMARKWLLDRSMFEGEEKHAMKESWQKKALIRLEALSLRNKDILVPFLSDLLNIADGSANETRDLALTLLQRLYLQQENTRQDILNEISSLLEHGNASVCRVSENLLLRCTHSDSEAFQNIFTKLFESSPETSKVGKTIQTHLSLI